MKLFVPHIVNAIPFRKELIHSMWAHGSFFVGLLLFVLISPQAPFRAEKYISVNLKNLGGTPGGSPGLSPPSVNKPSQTVVPVKPPSQKPEIKKEPVKQKVTPPTPPQQKVQKLTPKAPVQQKIVPPQTKPQPKTPSLSERLKNRFEEVKGVETTKKFVEPQKFVEAKQTASASPLCGTRRMVRNTKKPDRISNTDVCSRYGNRNRIWRRKSIPFCLVFRDDSK
jgi:outer membrane biosynthesis protein TonB